jgi:hypothetical protein
VETKRFVGSFVHVILTRQTCGQSSSRAAESKRQALGNYFSSEFAIGSEYQNVEETEILVFAPLRDMRLENRCAVATSEGGKCVLTQEKPSFAIALRFSNRKSRSCAQT